MLLVRPQIDWINSEKVTLNSNARSVLGESDFDLIPWQRSGRERRKNWRESSEKNVSFSLLIFHFFSALLKQTLLDSFTNSFFLFLSPQFNSRLNLITTAQWHMLISYEYLVHMYRHTCNQSQVDGETSYLTLSLAFARNQNRSAQWLMSKYCPLVNW